MLARTKLPKQWLHWVKKARLKPKRQRGKDNGYYLFGRDRHWRVNCYGYFECSCPTEHFDRWANSRGAHMTVIPQTEADFLTAVRDLIDSSKNEV